MRHYSQVLEINPEYELAHFYRGSAFSQLGDLDAAISDYSYLIQKEPGQASIALELARLYSLRSIKQPSVSDTQEVESKDIASALDFLEKAYTTGHPEFTSIINNADFAPLHSNKRFIQLKERLDLA